MMDVKVHVRLTIEFSDRTPIVDTLRKIESGVTQTLADFHPDF